MSDRWFAVLNPRSAGGRAARDRSRIVRQLSDAGVDFELAVSSHAGHALMLAEEAASSGYRKFVAIGGDGTLNEVLNGALPAGFASYTSPVLSISADGDTSTGNVFVVFVVFAAIRRYCGGGMLIAPDAKSDDGLLDVVIVENISKWELLLNIRRLFDGTIGNFRKARCLRADGIEIAAPVPVASEADGELLASTPLKISVLRRRIQVVISGDRKSS